MTFGMDPQDILQQLPYANPITGDSLVAGEPTVFDAFADYVGWRLPGAPVVVSPAPVAVVTEPAVPPAPSPPPPAPTEGLNWGLIGGALLVTTALGVTALAGVGIAVYATRKRR